MSNRMINIIGKKKYRINDRILDLNDIDPRVLMAIILDVLDEEKIAAEIAFWSTSEKLKGRISNDLGKDREATEDS